MRKALHIIWIILWFVILTIATQIGGLAYFLWLLLCSRVHWISKRSRFIKWFGFIPFYLLIVFLIVPPVAQLGDREPLPCGSNNVLKPHSFVSVLGCRNYVKSTTKTSLLNASALFHKETGASVYYLDANFPFIDGFPLIPHLSHNDGRKVDLCFIYSKHNKTVQSPSWMGYGFYSDPTPSEVNTTQKCLDQGHWQYNFTRFFSWFPDKEVELDEALTKRLILALLHQTSTQKIFIEPHLKSRMGLELESKVRFHGCHAVRHDDHIHCQTH